MVTVSYSSENVPPARLAIVLHSPEALESAKKQGKSIEELTEEFLRAQIKEAIRKGEELWDRLS